MQKNETFSIAWAEDDPDPCILCGAAIDSGPIGWRQQPDPGPLCPSCLVEKHLGLSLLLTAVGTRVARCHFPNEPLTLEDLAALVDRSDQLSRATMDHMRQLIRSSPQYASQLAYLEGLAQDAGLAEHPHRLTTGLLCHQEFNRLLEATGWRHPAEVLDPDGGIGISYPELIHIAEARLRRGDGSATLEMIRDRLELAWSEEKAKTECVGTFVAQLLEVDPEDAERLLRRAGQEYRFYARRREQPGEEKEGMS